MQFDVIRYQRQSEPGALVATTEPAVYLVKRIGDLRDLIGGNADARIGDADNRATTLDSCAHSHSTAGRRKFERVRKQIQDDLAEQARVHLDRRQIGGDLALEADLGRRSL